MSCRWSWCRWCRWCKGCRKCCVNEVKNWIWQQFFGKKKPFAGVLGRKLHHQKRRQHWDQIKYHQRKNGKRNTVISMAQITGIPKLQLAQIHHLVWFGRRPSFSFLKIGLELPVWGMIKLKCWMLQKKLNNCVATFAIVKRVLAWYSQISPGYILIQEINACISTVRIVLTASSALYVFVLAWSSHDFHTMSHSTFKFRMG